MWDEVVSWEGDWKAGRQEELVGCGSGRRPGCWGWGRRRC